ncbi:MAG: putative Ig domain-containing protein [Bacteroidetes bacterium]|nr:putative Ig domain-containing protein [Bacteroidota bacterium]
MKAVSNCSALKIAFLIFTSFLFFNYPSSGQSIYVAAGASGTGSITDPAGLQDALDMARTNGQDDVLYLQSGYYDASASSFTYDTTGNDNHSVMVSGGWNSTYVMQTMDYSSLLDGGGLNQVFYIGANKPGLDFNFTLDNLTIQNGYTSNKAGAGLHAYTGSTTNNDVGNVNLFIDQCYFNNNYADYNMSGGAIYANGYFEITASKFYTNVAYNGGAIVSTTKPDGDYSLSPLIENCYFEDNMNYGNQGSTIWHNVALRIFNSTIKGRSDGVSSSGNGSAIWGNAGSFTIAHNCIFTRIRIEYWGCSIQAFDGGMEIVNCVFEDNQVLTNGFGAVAYYHNNGATDRKIIITNCTFIRNYSYIDYSGAIHMRLNGNDSCIVTNCIFADDGSYPVTSEYGYSFAGMSYSLLQGGFDYIGFFDGGNNLLDVDPLFVNTSDDYHLTSTSPCINAGDNHAPSILSTDLEGTVRTLGSAVDMGPYEFDQAPVSVLLNTYSVNENVPVGSLVALLSADDPDAGDIHTFELTNGDGTNDADNSSFSISNDSLFILQSPNFEQQSAFHIFLRVMDSDGKDTTTAVVIAVIDINEAPVVSNPIPDQQATEGFFFNFTFADNTFADEDAGDVLNYQAKLSNGNQLPEWLSFDGNTRSFSGTPDDTGTLQITVTAKDAMSLSTIDQFALVVIPQSGIDNPAMSALAVFPNPASGISLYIRTDNSFTHDCSIRIYDLEGSVLLKNERMPSSHVIDISGLSSGTYLLVIDNGGMLYRAKFKVVR